MITKEDIQLIIEKNITPEQFIVEINVTSNNAIFIAIDGFNGITINDCINLSRIIESSFDREIDDFELEVSSAGLSEPFRVIQQYKKNTNQQLDILLKDGSKFSARLISVADNGIQVSVTKTTKSKETKKKETNTAEEFIEFENIKHSKLILSFK